MIFKNTLGVHSKASNLALHTELGLYPVFFKSYKLMFKYYSRLMEIEKSTNTDTKFMLLKSAFKEDQSMYSNNCNFLGLIVCTNWRKLLIYHL